MYQYEGESLSQILASLAAGQSLSASAWQQLVARSLADGLRAKAFGIAPENVEEMLRERTHFLRSVYPDVFAYCQKTGLAGHPNLLEILWNLWLPLAMQLATARQQLGRPFIQGILGGQGTGKTTLAAILTLILERLGYHTIGLSLDDLYKTYSDRLILQEQDPRLIWRGPPGTHDIELGITVLDGLRQQQKAMEVPRFDKSAWGGVGDRTESEIVEGVDIVLFEGWFVGVRPIDLDAFDTAPPPILTLDDRVFARDMNAKLGDYLPLWQRLDRLILLCPVDYRLSQQWRCQAERLAIAAGKSGMTDEIVDLFVEYFWKSLHPELFIEPMTRNSKWVDLVIEIERDHSPGAVYRPGDRVS